MPAEQGQRIQMGLRRESGMTPPLIAAAMGVSLSPVNRAHMADDHGAIEASPLKPKPSGGRNRENMILEDEKALLEPGAKNLPDFFDSDMRQLLDFELRPYRSNDSI
jgi:hypothetical protein